MDEQKRHVGKKLPVRGIVAVNAPRARSLFVRIGLSVVAPVAWVLIDFGGLLRDSELGPRMLRIFGPLASVGMAFGVAGSLVLCFGHSVPSKARTLAAHACVFGTLSALMTIVVTWRLSHTAPPVLWVTWSLLAAMAAAFGANAALAHRQQTTGSRLLGLAGTVGVFGAALAIVGSMWMRSPEKALSIRLPLEEAHPGIPLGQILGSEFERAAVFGPYTSKQQMEKELAIRWPPDQANVVAMTEGYQLLIVARGDQVVSMLPIARALGDYCVEKGMLVRASGARCSASPRRNRPDVLGRGARSQGAGCG